MVTLLYGEDAYSIKEAVEKIKSPYLAADSSGLNIITLDGAILTRGELENTIFSMPFLVSEKLVIIKNLIRENPDKNLKKYLKEKLDRIPSFTKLILVESGDVKLTESLAKELIKSKKGQKFSSTGLDFFPWIDLKANEEGLMMSRAGISKLMVLLGEDRFRIDNEIKKLALYQKGKRGQKEVSLEEIEELVEGKNNTTIFQFIDALAAKDSKNAVRFFYHLLDSGINELYILTMIVYQYRNLLSYFELKKEGQRDDKIIKTMKLHPFVFRKISQIAHRYSHKRVKEIYFLLQSTDSKIKTGALLPTLALVLLIMKICTD